RRRRKKTQTEVETKTIKTTGRLPRGTAARQKSELKTPEEETYTWTQTLGTVDVYIPVQEGTKASNWDVKIGAGTLKVGLKGQTPLVDGKLHMKVKPDDCMWTLEGQKVIHLNLEKSTTCAGGPASFRETQNRHK
ncbi:nuclear distribution protein C, putative, partial [Toxoplasma gondii ME49]